MSRERTNKKPNLLVKDELHKPVYAINNSIKSFSSVKQLYRPEMKTLVFDSFPNDDSIDHFKQIRNFSNITQIMKELK